MLIRKKDKRKKPRVNRHNESSTTATTTTTNTSSDTSISTDGRRSIEKVHILETGKTMVILIDCKDFIDFKAVNEPLLPNKTFSRVAVPEPVVKAFPISVKFSGFRMNKNLVKYWEKQEEDLNEQVEYDVDDEDLIWLEEINRDREKRGKRLISQEELSALLDRLEKESYFQSTLISSDTKLKNQVEAIDNINEDAPCSVCLDGECVANNVILFCDMCNLAVHQECYGVPYVPEGQWVCRRCLQSPSTPVSCILCHSNSGAFKQTDKGDWVHVVCAIWVPEVHFANTTFLEPVVGIEKIDRQRWKLVCYICRKPGGACIQCDKSTCYKAFHVTCAQQAGLYMNLHEEVNKKKPNQKQKNNKNKRAYAESDDEDKENNPNGALMNHSSEEDVDVRKCAYCDVHTPLDAVSPSKLKGVRGNLEEYLKRARKLRMEKARQILTEIQNRPPVINLPAIPQDRIIEISKSFEIEECDQFLDKLISYWKMKRFSRNGVPLVRRFQKSQLKPPSLISTTSEDEEKQAEIERAQIEEFMMLKKLRNDLERVRLLVEMVKKRERIKREQLLIDHLSIKWQCAEANSKFK